MFEILTWVLLVSLFGGLAWFVLGRLVAPAIYTWLGTIVLILFLVLAFVSPANQTVAEIWSFFALFFRPLSLAIVLLLGAAFGVTRGGFKGAVRTQAFAALLILLLSSNPFIAYWLSQQAEQSVIQADQRRRELCQAFCPDPILSPTTQATDAIVLLGWGTTQPALPYRTQIQLTDAGDRILYTARLYQEQLGLGNRPRVIVSAGPRPELEATAETQATTIEANDVATLLINAGVPREDILLETTGRDVRTSAVAVSRLLAEQQVGNRILLVSSALNINRAYLTFSRLGLRVTPRPTTFYTFQPAATPRRRLRIADFVPSAEALLVVTRLVDEFFLSIYYFLRGWLAPLGL